MMEIKDNQCRLCLSDDEFKIPIFGLYGRKIELPEKIEFCLRLPVSEGDCLKYVCYNCVHSVVNFYSFLQMTKNSHLKMLRNQESNLYAKPTGKVLHMKSNSYMTKRSENIKNEDYDFSFLDCSDVENQNQRLQDKYLEQKSPSFSFFSEYQTNNIVNINAGSKPVKNDLEFLPLQKHEDSVQSYVFSRNRASKPTSNINEKSMENYKKYTKPSELPNWRKCGNRSSVIPNEKSHNTSGNTFYGHDEVSPPRQPRQLSRDLFESQSQECFNSRGVLDWQLTPDEGIIKRIRSSLLNKNNG